MGQSSLSTSHRHRYAIIGTGGRCRMYVDAILGPYSPRAALVALSDTNSVRLQHNANQVSDRLERGTIATYKATDFERMIAEQHVQTVIVITIDRMHHDYIVRALRAGCDVITEKPMTIDVPKCREILRALKETGRDLKVAFNYRYAPARTKVKELLLDGRIGQVTALHFEWMLNTQHGADYFRRWHRDKYNSGGLMVHKATHHFDLVNWWIDSQPELVFGLGKLAFYGRANAEARGESHPWYRSTGNPLAQDDPFAIDLNSHSGLRKLYLEAEVEDGYLRDQNPFGDGISIEDTMAVAARYRCGALLTYSLIAYAPWEGLRIAFTGTKGRIDLHEVENAYINAGGDAADEGSTAFTRITLQQQRGKPEEVSFEEGTGGHGGGDERMLEDIFAPSPEPDRFCRAAGPIDGARSILTGIAANESFQTGRPVLVDDLLRLPEAL